MSTFSTLFETHWENTRYLRAARAVQRGGPWPGPPRPPDAIVTFSVLQLAGMGERKYDTNAERQAAYRERRHKREYDERRARAKDYAATLGDALGWDEERVEEALVRVASHEDGLVAVELALQAFARTKAAR